MLLGVEVVNVALLVFLVLVAGAIVISRNLIVDVLLMSSFSLVMAVLYLVMNAPDVAITEAAVGAGFSTVLLLMTLSHLGWNGEMQGVTLDKGKVVMAGFACAAVFGLLVYVVMDLPNFGYGMSPANAGDAAHYVSDAYSFTGIPNLVTAILASFRGYDTLCETVVIFTAATCVFLLIGKGKRENI